MVNFILVQLLALLVSAAVMAGGDGVYQRSYLGEKNLEGYGERYQPLVFQDIYQGKLSFEDDRFFQSYFEPFLLTKEHDLSFFFRSELNGGALCSNELLSAHFDQLRYSYRLITLSYFFEAQNHLRLMSNQLRLKNGCGFVIKDWAKTCTPKSKEMKNFLEKLVEFLPDFEESFSSEYNMSSWWKEFSQGKYKSYSHYRLGLQCQKDCTEKKMEAHFKKVCEEDQKLMTSICSEEDEIYGLSTQRDAYYLLGLSNIINTFNQKGEALGCLRRFSQVMAHKEVRHKALSTLFPALQTSLRDRFKERFLQGRAFFLGSGKEFEEKGLTDLYVKSQPISVGKAIEEPSVSEASPPTEVVKIADNSKAILKENAPPSKAQVKEILKPLKSAFLIASEIRDIGDLDIVEVDMLKLKYDYVFSLNMINILSERLKSFMTRSALTEMMTYDKLGSKQGPVPLLFLKFMIDMQEHQGLWNLTAILGDKFYVANEIDAFFKPRPELVQLINDDSTGNQWQLFILKP